MNRPLFVAGLDLSLTATGIATIGPTGDLDTRTVESTAPKTPTLELTAHRLRDLAERICEGLDPITCEVIVEAPSYGSRFGSSHERAGLWWAVVLELTRRAVRVHTVPPTTAKKWITGGGKADKAIVAIAVSRLFPDHTFGSNNETDAAAFAHILAVHHGYAVDSLPGRHNPATVAVKWAP